MAAPTAERCDAPTESSARRYRPDIDGLRAIAVVLVVAHHVGIPGFRSGFIGVDVFFVISGFLITGLILDEIRSTGRIALGGFWARRIRRIIPLAAMVTAVTLVAGILLLNPLAWHTLFHPARAATTFVANVHYASAEQGYFSPSTRNSPFLHFWSLSVEEQWYVGFPLVVGAALLLRRGEASLGVVRLTLVGVTAVSLVISWWSTNSGTPSGYYGLLSRGWELGAGALLAAYWPQIEERRTEFRHLFAWCGLALIGAGLVLVDRAGFPTWGALFPVLGTVLLIVGEPSTTRLGTMLGRPGVLAVGRWSYGWYLWHWPALAIGTVALSDSVPARVSLAMASLALAVVTYRYVEQPARLLRLSTGWSVGFGATLIVAVLLAAQAAHIYERGFFDDREMAEVQAAAEDFVDIDGACTGVDARLLLHHCVTGAGEGSPLLLYGDSHANHWRPGMEKAAADLGLPVVRSILGGCYGIGPETPRMDPRCVERRSGLLPLVEDLDPVAVVLALSSNYADDESRSDGEPTWRRDVESLARSLRQRGVPLLVILGTPTHDENPLACLAEGGDELDCASRGVDLHHDVRGQVEAALERSGHGAIVDPARFLCPGERCAIRFDGVVALQDNEHVTATFALRQAERFERALAAVVSGS